MSGFGLPQLTDLRSRMQWLQARQKLLAENVANADTPGFKPRDLKAPSRPGEGVEMAQTAPGHLSASGGRGAADPRAARRFETEPSGNAVTLEDEMTKLADTQMDFQTAASLYAKSLSLLRIAAGKRG